MTMLLGKKVGMTRVYDDNGTIVPVTVIQAGPCAVLQVKTVETDGYAAVQMGYDDVKKSRQQKPAIGHCKAAEAKPKRFVREMRLSEDSDQYAPGQKLTVESFADVKYVDVVGTSKGKGYAGVVKRHGFKGQLASHGVERKHRSPGSISVAPGADGRSIKKGKKMAGHLGCVRCTSRNLDLVEVDTENNLLLVAGAVPGPRNGYVVISSARTKS
ncbi:MAG: 50S ribosomal protein L3 [Sedimentisphaerales bacterium]|nr:50S ribosomal protein L3 [Sedimentisphaerales bacterium]